MAQRTSVDAVKGIMAAGKDYDTEANPDLQPYIDAATLFVDRVVTCAAAKGIALSSAEAEMIERLISAHMYQGSDQGYVSKKTEGAEGVFQGKTGLYLDGTQYGQRALMLDPSGCVKNLANRNVATAFWAGKPPSQQIPYCQRD